MQSYKVIIADDEWTIRKGLANSVDWGRLGYQVVAEVMDGQDVLDYLQEQDVDVVFTDVQMCQVSGLQVARWVHEHRPEVKVVLISGYKEFDYVKEAMKYKVFDYVLKPVDLMALEETFRKVKVELDERKSGQVKNLYTYLNYLENPECQAVLMLEGVLLESVVNGNLQKTEVAINNWKEAIGKVKQEYIPQLVFQIVELLYRRMEKEKIFLEACHDKVLIFHEIRELSGDALISAVEEVLFDIARAIAGKKSTALQDVVKKVKEYIDTHIAEDFGVEEVAAYVYLSRSHLSREFKVQVGISIIDYIIQRRMETAMEMVKQGKLSTDQIAAAVGYADSRYFQRSFKKYTGYSIREYRNLQR